MKPLTKLTTIPENSAISNGFERVDYFDVYRVVKSTTLSAEEVTAKIFKLPHWVIWLMKIRDSLVGIFGLKTEKELREGQLGERQTTLFHPMKQNENEIVMGENDKHLNFRVSVLVDRENSFIYLTTIVHFHNFWGRAYFLPVKPFHKLIVKSLLKRQANNWEA